MFRGHGTVKQIASEATETAAIKVKSATELKVKALADQAANLKQQATRMKAQQGLAKAQERLRKSMQP